jgi:hypothetical protein
MSLPFPPNYYGEIFGGMEFFYYLCTIKTITKIIDNE